MPPPPVHPSPSVDAASAGLVAVDAVDLPPDIAQLFARPRDLRDEGRLFAVKHRRSVRFTADGPERIDGALEPLDHPLPYEVVESGERPRVAAFGGHLRLLVYLDRGDAQPVMVARAPLRAEPDLSAADQALGFVTLRPGAWVDVEERRPEAVLVRSVERPFAGWVAPDRVSAIGPLRDDEWKEPGKPMWSSTRRVAISKTPGGERLGDVEEGELVIETPTLSRRGHRWVTYRPPCQMDHLLSGFVPEQALESFSDGPDAGGGGCASGSLIGHGMPGLPKGGEHVTLAAGRFLVDPDGPTVVGCVANDVDAIDLGQGRYAVPSLWGPLVVRLAPADVDATCGPPGRR